MSAMRRPPAITIRSLILLTLLAVMPGHVFAQGGPVEIPQYASAKNYGTGWVCDPGYRVLNGVRAGMGM
jgi:hypothetical protein